MAKYYIPFAAPGGTIHVQNDDIFVIEESAAQAIRFESAQGHVTNFEVKFSETNLNPFEIKIGAKLNLYMTITNDISLRDVSIDARTGSSTTACIGDNVSLGQFQGADLGPNTAVVGTDFRLGGGTGASDLNQDGAAAQEVSPGGFAAPLQGANSASSNRLDHGALRLDQRSLFNVTSRFAADFFKAMSRIPCYFGVHRWRPDHLMPERVCKSCHRRRMTVN